MNFQEQNADVSCTNTAANMIQETKEEAFVANAAANMIEKMKEEVSVAGPFRTNMHETLPVTQCFLVLLSHVSEICLAIFGIHFASNVVTADAEMYRRNSL